MLKKTRIRIMGISIVMIGAVQCEYDAPNTISTLYPYYSIFRENSQMTFQDMDSNSIDSDEETDSQVIQSNPEEDHQWVIIPVDPVKDGIHTVGKSIVFRMDGDLDSRSLIWPDNETKCFSSNILLTNNEETCITGELSSQDDGFHYTALKPLEYDTIYTMRFRPTIRFMDGTTADEKSYSFRTETDRDSPEPMVGISNLLWSQEELLITFNEPIVVHMDSLELEICSDAMMTGLPVVENQVIRVPVRFPERTGACFLKISGGVEDVYGNTLDDNALVEWMLEAPPAKLIISEFKMAGNPDYLELLVTESGSIDGMEICQRTSCNDLPEDWILYKNDRILIHGEEGINDDSITDGPSPTAYDMFEAISLIATDSVLYLRDRTGTVLHGVAYSNKNGEWTGCGTVDNTACLDDLLESGMWELIETGNWYENDAITNDGNTNDETDFYMLCPENVDEKWNSGWLFSDGNLWSETPGQANQCPLSSFGNTVNPDHFIDATNHHFITEMKKSVVSFYPLAFKMHTPENFPIRNIDRFYRKFNLVMFSLLKKPMNLDENHNISV